MFGIKRPNSPSDISRQLISFGKCKIGVLYRFRISANHLSKIVSLLSRRVDFGAQPGAGDNLPWNLHHVIRNRTINRFWDNRNGQQTWPLIGSALNTQCWLFYTENEQTRNNWKNVTSQIKSNLNSCFYSLLLMRKFTITQRNWNKVKPYSEITKRKWLIGSFLHRILTVFFEEEKIKYSELSLVRST